MNTILLKNTSNVPYIFADKKTSRKDSMQATRLLKKVYLYGFDFLSVDTLPSSVSFLTTANKTCRIIIYDFEKLLQLKNIFAVLFLGNTRPNIKSEENKNFFNTDWEIAMSLTGNASLLCYASQELSNGNWFNIVLFAKETAKDDVLVSEKHKYASRVLAPKRFSWVRLHNAVIPGGLDGYKTIQLTKTKYYDFDTMWFAQRIYT